MMKALNKKTTLIIFSLLTAFLLLNLIILNATSYKREYEGLERSLNFNERKPDFKDMFVPKELDNMMIMDHEVYTVLLNNNKVTQIIKHSNTTSDFDIKDAVKRIINGNRDYYLGNLYLSKYAFNYSDNTITVINTSSVRSSLSVLLVGSTIIFLIAEIGIYFVSKKIANWITAPALESFNKQKDFIADASHELKTPLAVIMASSDELKEDKKNAQYVNNIKQESEKMNNLIKSMLDLSKLESGITKDSYKEEDLSKIINKVCLTFEAVAFEQEVEISSDIQDNILFNCNKDEIERLISILIDNAIKHSNKKSVIKVITKKEKSNIIISVTNSGDPIKEEDEEKIFERFYRSDKSRKRSENRYGLGLAIAKNIVINHNGTIKAHSEDGKTTFTINLKK